MRVKFEATDATGKMHKRSSTGRVYSHCLVIHFAAHPPSKLWPRASRLAASRMGSKSCAGRTHCQPLVQKSVCRGHRDPRRNSSVMLFPSERHELPSRFNREA
jgi:hypothetical protein